MSGFEPSYVFFGVAVVAALVFYFGFVRRRKEDAPIEKIEEKLREGVGDALTGQMARVSASEETIEPQETATADVSESPKETVANDSSAEDVPEIVKRPLQEEPETPDVPPVALKRPEPAAEIRPLVGSAGRTHPNIDPMLDTFVRFTPKEGFFTTDRLVQIAAFIEEAHMQSLVSADFFNQSTGFWLESFRGNDACSDLVVKMQLANRNAVADELTASRFLQLANRIAIEIDAEVEQPDVVEILEQAENLKHLIAKFDNSLTLFVRTVGAYDTQSFQDLMRRDGFTRRDVCFIKCAAGTADPYFSVMPDLEDPTKIALELDIPLCDPALLPLSDLFETANDMACVLNGTLTDQSGNPIGSAAASYIDGELKKLVREMQTQGIAPGDERTIKLFSR